MSEQISLVWVAEVERVGRELIRALWKVQDWGGTRVGDLSSELSELLEEPEGEWSRG